ncbi:hypothetical protein [Endozoicomonas montiporae]|nr:hypothetical protein [Endozoicomonas montiporae]AMO55664.1 hypothetical protein EZMO1_1496 [Endozoicomonas montiporae CL-33]
MDVPVFATKRDLDLIHVRKLAKNFRKDQLSDADGEQLAGDLEALNRLKTSSLISNYESIRCEKRIYKRYQALVREYGHKVRKQADGNNV